MTVLRFSVIYNLGYGPYLKKVIQITNSKDNESGFV